MGTALPMTENARIGPKYRPSSESAKFMTRHAEAARPARQTPQTDRRFDDSQKARGSRLGNSSSVTHGQRNEQLYDGAQGPSNKRKRAAVPAPVQGEAASRRPFGRPGPPLPRNGRAVVGRDGRRNRCSTRSNRGIATRNSIPAPLNPPRSTPAARGQRQLMLARARNSGHPASWWTASS